MKLSEILRSFYVLPLEQSEIVTFYCNENGLITISWFGSGTGKRHCQEFDDQEIDTSERVRVKGQFSVETIEGEVVSFIALDPVALQTED